MGGERGVWVGGCWKAWWWARVEGGAPARAEEGAPPKRAPPRRALTRFSTRRLAPRQPPGRPHKAALCWEGGRAPGRPDTHAGRGGARASWHPRCLSGAPPARPGRGCAGVKGAGRGSGPRPMGGRRARGQPIGRAEARRWTWGAQPRGRAGTPRCRRGLGAALTRCPTGSIKAQVHPVYPSSWGKISSERRWQVEILEPKSTYNRGSLPGPSCGAGRGAGVRAEAAAGWGPAACGAAAAAGGNGSQTPSPPLMRLPPGH